MTNSEHWTHRLSEYLDDELSVEERAACRSHVEGCGHCAATLDELRAIVAGASTLSDRPPERDLWAEIETRLPPRAGADRTDVVPLDPRARRMRRVALSVPQLIAAAVALVVFSAGSVWLLVPGGAEAPAVAAAVDSPRGTGAPTTGASAPLAGPAGRSPVAFAATYEEAIAELELELERRRSRLDPETVRVVEDNLAIIDAAIAEANQALTEDPSSGFLHTRLAGAMRQKVDLLRRVAAIEHKES